MIEFERPDERDRRIQEPEERLSRLSQDDLRITEDLDFSSVLHGMEDSVRSLASSPYGVITVPGKAEHTSEFIVSGLASEECQGLLDMGFLRVPQGDRLQAYCPRVLEYFVSIVTCECIVGRFLSKASDRLHRIDPRESPARWAGRSSIPYRSSPDRLPGYSTPPLVSLGSHHRCWATPSEHRPRPLAGRFRDRGSR